MNFQWDAFLLLPGDGLLLVDDGLVVYADKVAERTLAVDGRRLAGQSLAALWPEAASAAEGIRPRLDVSGPEDRVLNWRGGERVVRLFRTDTGIGIGVLGDEQGRVGATGDGQILYQRVIKAMSESVLVTTAEPFDRPGPVIVFCNDTFLRETGYSRAEVIGRSPRIIQGPATTDDSRKQFRMAFEKWQSSSVEVQDHRKDGSTFWTEISFAPVADETGWFTHWVSVGADTTERRRAEQRDREQRAVVQGVLDSMPSQCVMIDGTGRIVATNAEWDRQWTLGEDGRPDWRSLNYLEVCRSGEGLRMSNPFALQAVDAIEELLAGRRESVVAEYVPDGLMNDSAVPRVFRLVALPLRGAQGAVLTHVDLTALNSRSGDDVSTRIGDTGGREDLIDRMDAMLGDQGSNGGFALIVVGIDNLSDVIDAFGHLDGDRLVEAIGHRLAEHLGPDCLTARLRGEEFAVLSTGVPDDEWDMEAYLGPLRDVLTQPIHLELAAVHASVSFGVARGAAPGANARDMLRDADSAMRAARRQRRGGWAEFTPTHRADAQARITAERLLAQAVDRSAFELVYQPIVDLEAGRTAASEALLRIREPDGNLIPPLAFLSALETGPHVEQVGEFVLNTALEVQSRWQREPGMERHRMSINVSARQLGTGRFKAAVQRALARHGVTPQNLTVEILENAIVRAGDEAESELRDLAEMGVGVAIDDFGTGYSAMSYLHYFPLTTVKIDRSFMLAADTPRGLRLLRAAGEVARAVSASTVVEGIETQAHLLAAQAAGIEYGQGYFFGRPTSAGTHPVRVSPKG